MCKSYLFKITLIVCVQVIALVFTSCEVPPCELACDHIGVSETLHLDSDINMVHCDEYETTMYDSVEDVDINETELQFVSTFEGNRDDACKEGRYEIGNDGILGFGVPSF